MTNAPLEGLRVIEFLGLGPGPFAAMLLADLGAEVVAVARPGAPRPALAENRLVVEIDIKAPEGRERIERLVRHADVLLEGFRPGVLERAALGPEDLREINPRLIYARMTGWGQAGPLAQSAGHDINYIALTGALHHAARQGQTPTPPANLLGDFGGGGMYMVTCILAAVHRRAVTGRGSLIDAAIVDGTAYLTAMLHEYRSRGAWSDEAGTNRLDTGAPYYDVYACADGRFVAVGALEAPFFAELVVLLGLDPRWNEQRSDPEHWPELREQIAAAVLSRTRDDWARAAGDGDACLSPVLTLAEAAEHPHMRARGTHVPAPDGQPGWRPAIPMAVQKRARPLDEAELLARWAGAVSEDD